MRPQFVFWWTTGGGDPCLAPLSLWGVRCSFTQTLKFSRESQEDHIEAILEKRPEADMQDTLSSGHKHPSVRLHVGPEAPGAHAHRDAEPAPRTICPEAAKRRAEPDWHTIQGKTASRRSSESSTLFEPSVEESEDGKLLIPTGACE